MATSRRIRRHQRQLVGLLALDRRPPVRRTTATVTAVGDVTVTVDDGDRTLTIPNLAGPVAVGASVVVASDGEQQWADATTGWAEGAGGVLYDARADGGNTNMSAGPITGAWIELDVPPDWQTFRMRAISQGRIGVGTGAVGAFTPDYDHEYRFDGGPVGRLSEELFPTQGNQEGAVAGTFIKAWQDTRGPTARPAGGLVEVRYYFYNRQGTATNTLSADNVTTTVELFRAS